MKDFTVSQLAGMIRKDWNNVSPHAEPYLAAMEQLNDVKDKYMMDSGEEIILRFLCNAISWRGDLAKNVKKELNRRVMEQL